MDRITKINDSSNLRGAGYDFKSKTLQVYFVSGTNYEYINVPSEIFGALCSAESPGRALNELVKPKFKYRVLAKG